MKKLFIVVSIAAISYLLAQTEFVKDGYDSLVKQNEVSKANKFEKVNTSELQSLRQQNASLVAKITALEHDIEALQIIQADSLALINNASKPKSVDIDYKETQSTLVALAQVDAKFTVVDAPNTPVIDNNISNNKNVKVKNVQEHQKRLQQQAVLRQVAQKMELAAIQSLAQ